MTFDDIFDGPPGSTPLEEEEKEALIPTTITTRAELNTEEQSNILSATAWLEGSRVKIKDLLSAKRLRSIHKRMFNRVWTWAGECF